VDRRWGRARRRGSRLSVLPIGLAVAVLGVGLIGPVGPVGPVGIHPVRAELPSSCGEDGEGCEQRIAMSGSSVAALANFPLSGSKSVTHAVVVLHGTKRNPVSAFAAMTAAVEKAGVAGRTLVLAPQFKSDEDDPSDGEAVWDDDGWKQGDAALKPKGGPSSFAVMDEIVTMLGDRKRFAGLRRITVAGHSAGGQFVQRYAVFGQAPDQVDGVTVDFLVANPSSFVYLDAARPVADGEGFAEPEASDCAGYDGYKYGLADRTGYPARLTPGQAVATYTARRVTIVNGAEDTVDNGNLDTDCEANLQGPNRLARGEFFHERMRALYPDAPHQRIVVPGVDHDKEALYGSAKVVKALFGGATPDGG
jgi:pimeloyl-ACP methyl ester carboxylesterase